MVVFTCGHCGESVQKPKVEKHYLTKCRNRNPNLSCMDCFKDFLGNDYEAHTKCITEEERYSGKGFTAKEKKGEKKQNAWVEMLQSVLDEQKNTSRNVLRIIETISKHNNTPRKKPKFINFVKNVCGQKTNPKDIDQAWDLISVKLTELSNMNAQNRNQSQKDKDNASVENGSTEENNQNSESLNGKLENGNHEEDKEDEEKDTVAEDKSEIQSGKVENNKLSKKQRKEEKKRKKYEAELLSAVAPPEEPEVNAETVVSKKGKKKNKENINGHDQELKEKKRKRQDTVTTLEVPEAVQNIESETLKVKASMKKLKMENELAAAKANENICLHDQNVALGEREVPENNGIFDWHAVIISILEKKGNELPFKRLQKKVLSEYSEFTGDEIDDRIADKFIKKLRSAPKVRVDKNRVLLLVDEE
ncbi:unnamed protein product, partial [Brenthis ino]